MKVAYIAPPNLLPEFGQLSDYHMVLPHLLLNSEAYALHYYNRARWDFCILDNGEAEGLSHLFPWSRLLATAISGGFKEIVLPDVMGGMHATLKAIKDVEKVALLNRGDIRYMAVVQGSGLHEILECVDIIASDFPWVQTLGIPRHLVALGNLLRFHAISHVVELGFDIHLLGASGIYPDEIKGYETAFPGRIRGIDTSLPFVYAQEKIRLVDPMMAMDRNVSRKKDYDDRDWTLQEVNLAALNCAQYGKWALT